MHFECFFLCYVLKYLFMSRIRKYHGYIDWFSINTDTSTTQTIIYSNTHHSLHHPQLHMLYTKIVSFHKNFIAPGAKFWTGVFWNHSHIHIHTNFIEEFQYEFQRMNKILNKDAFIKQICTMHLKASEKVKSTWIQFRRCFAVPPLLVS